MSVFQNISQNPEFLYFDVSETKIYYGPQYYWLVGSQRLLVRTRDDSFNSTLIFYKWFLFFPTSTIE